MILRTRGKAVNITNNIVGRVTRDINSTSENTILLADNNVNIVNNTNFLAILTEKENYQAINNEKVVYKIPTLDHLQEGDIVTIEENGNIYTLYRIDSYHNTLMATNRCNSNCIMCSQPPKDRDDIAYVYEINQKLIPLIPKDCLELGVSGGEPTMMGEYFFHLIRQLKEELPETEIHVLTNGRSFAWNSFAERLGEIDNKRVMLGIPLYSDYYQLHDYIVQAKNAFYQTMLGFHNLARYEQRLELRVVLHKQTIPRLTKLARYIYKNLPFVEHIAFMGLEYIGYTPHNIDKLWIDPYLYQNELSEAVDFLSGQGMNVSIYNTPLCLLPENLWCYSRKSISDWKNAYAPECQSCLKKDDCGGFFEWNLNKKSEYITPFTEK